MIDDLIARLRSWAQNEEMVDQYFTQHGRDCIEVIDALEAAREHGKAMERARDEARALADQERQRAERAEAERDALKAWKERALDAAVTDWCYRKEHEDDARLLINDLLVNARRQALDPTISADAERLRDTYKSERDALLKQAAHEMWRMVEESATEQRLDHQIAELEEEMNAYEAERKAKGGVLKIEGDRVIFSTGKTRYANNGIIGLGPDMEVSQGYDGDFYSGNAWLKNKDTLTKAELVELADYMIEQWQKFRSLHAAIDAA